MITEKSESKTLAKDTSCKCKGKFDGRKCKFKLKVKWQVNVDASVKSIIYLKKITFGILLNVLAKMANI